MPNYFNYFSLEYEDIATAKGIYIICINNNLQLYKIVASSQDLKYLKYDPETRVTSYWPISLMQINNAPQEKISEDNNLRISTFSLSEIKEYFQIDPEKTVAFHFLGLSHENETATQGIVTNNQNRNYLITEDTFFRPFQEQAQQTGERSLNAQPDDIWPNRYREHINDRSYMIWNDSMWYASAIMVCLCTTPCLTLTRTIATMCFRNTEFNADITNVMATTDDLENEFAQEATQNALHQRTS